MPSCVVLSVPGASSVVSGVWVVGSDVASFWAVGVLVVFVGKVAAVPVSGLIVLPVAGVLVVIVVDVPLTS